MTFHGHTTLISFYQNRIHTFIVYLKKFNVDICICKLLYQLVRNFWGVFLSFWGGIMTKQGIDGIIRVIKKSGSIIQNSEHSYFCIYCENAI